MARTQRNNQLDPSRPSLTFLLPLIPRLFTDTSKHIRFYRAMLCIRGTSHGPVSVCPSVTSRCSTKTDKRRITQITPHDSSVTLVSDVKDFREIRPGSPPTGAPNAGGVGQNRRLSTNNRLYLENGTR